MFGIHEFREAAGELQNLATETGVSASRISELEQAAIRLGGSGEMVTTGLRGVSAFFVQLSEGSPEALRALALLGVRFQELRGLSIDQQFLRLGEALNRLPNAAQRSQVAMQIFGDGSGQMLRLCSKAAKPGNGWPTLLAAAVRSCPKTTCRLPTR